MSTLLSRRKNHTYRFAGRTQNPAQPAQAQGHKPDPTMEPIPDWAKLSREDDVSLYLDGQELASGSVDMRAMDGSVLWIVHHDGRGRAMFLRNDGPKVYRRPKRTNKRTNRVFYKA